MFISLWHVVALINTYLDRIGSSLCIFMAEVYAELEKVTQYDGWNSFRGFHVFSHNSTSSVDFREKYKMHLCCGNEAEMSQGANYER